MIHKIDNSFPKQKWSVSLNFRMPLRLIRLVLTWELQSLACFTANSVAHAPHSESIIHEYTIFATASALHSIEVIENAKFIFFVDNFTLFNLGRGIETLYSIFSEIKNYFGREAKTSSSLAQGAGWRNSSVASEGIFDIFQWSPPCDPE